MMRFGTIPFVLAAALSLALKVGTVCADGPAEILKKVDANLQPESFESYRKLINIEPSGAKREFLLYTIKKGNDKIVSLFLSPASEKGRATLRLGDNMWLYIPTRCSRWSFCRRSKPFAETSDDSREGAKTQREQKGYFSELGALGALAGDAPTSVCSPGAPGSSR